MLNLHGITSRFSPSTAPARITFGVGSLVEVTTMFHGKQLGIIERIAVSPYYPESIQGIMRARIGSLAGNPFFIDYLLVEELVPAEPDFELELEYDPEYAAFLHDTAASEELADCTVCDHAYTEKAMCDGCGHCIHCCDCTPEDEVEDEYLEWVHHVDEDYAYEDRRDEALIARLSR